MWTYNNNNIYLITNKLQDKPQVWCYSVYICYKVNLSLFACFVLSFLTAVQSTRRFTASDYPKHVLQLLRIKLCFNTWEYQTVILNLLKQHPQRQENENVIFDQMHTSCIMFAYNIFIALKSTSVHVLCNDEVASRSAVMFPNAHSS